MVIHNNINIKNENIRCNKQFYFNVSTINIGLDSRQIIIVVTIHLQ